MYLSPILEKQEFEEEFSSVFLEYKAYWILCFRISVKGLFNCRINYKWVFVDDKSKNVLKKLYMNFNCPKIFTGVSEAEMIKYSSNAFLATKISFINELGNLCKKMDIDTYVIAEGMGYDKRIGMFFLMIYFF